MDEVFASKGKIGEVSRMLLQDLSTPEYLGKMLEKGVLPANDAAKQKRYSMTKAISFTDGGVEYTLCGHFDVIVTKEPRLGDSPA